MLFSHAGAINAAAGAVLGQERTIWFAPDYCSVTRLAPPATAGAASSASTRPATFADLLLRG